jgi:hypothetical protein
MSMHIEHKALDAAEPSVLLVAKDLGDDGPDGDRRFDFVITHDRELVVRAAQPLLDRLLPAS